SHRHRHTYRNTPAHACTQCVEVDKNLDLSSHTGESWRQLLLSLSLVPELEKINSLIREKKGNYFLLCSAVCVCVCVCACVCVVGGWFWVCMRECVSVLMVRGNMFCI